MNAQWEQVTVTRIALAMYVKQDTGRIAHTDRPFHGFVINDESGCRDYIFSDGQVLRTRPGDLFYLPKGSSYEVKSVQSGGCYAINFDGDIQAAPFAVSLKSSQKLTKSFRTAAEDWKKDARLGRICALRAVYDAIYRIKRDEREYISQHTAEKIAPALERLDDGFTDSGLTVAELAQLCGMSQVYFRRIFQNRFGISPREYLIRKRLEYARQLLLSGQFTVGEVASLCGYSEPCHFSREFSARVGVSPSQYSGDWDAATSKKE